MMNLITILAIVCFMFLLQLEISTTCQAYDLVLCDLSSLFVSQVKDCKWLPEVLPPGCLLIISTTPHDHSHRTLQAPKRTDTTFLDLKIPETAVDKNEVNLRSRISNPHLMSLWLLVLSFLEFLDPFLPFWTS